MPDQTIYSVQKGLMRRIDISLIKTIENVQRQFKDVNNVDISFVEASRILSIMNNRPINFNVEINKSKRRKRNYPMSFNLAF